VFDAEAPSSQLAIAELKKPGVSERLHKIAMWSTKSETDAKDLVQEAICRVLDPEDSPWPASKRTFLTHMGFVMRYVWDRQRQKASAQREVLDDGLALDEGTPSHEARADDELERHRSLAVLRQLGERLLGQLGDDTLAKDILEHGAKEGHEPAELQQALRRDIGEIYTALKKIKYHARKILEEWNATEERRMTKLRELATKKDEATP
jgi:DNA-directed RNA polymerase specialized sigma24 family protein